MVNVIYLLLVFIVLSACAATSDDKKEKYTDPYSEGVSCLEPPGEAETTECKAQVDAAIPKVLEILKADYSDEVKYERIRAELPDSEAFERLHYRLCAKYIDGELTDDQYFGFANQIVPVHRRWLRNRKSI